MRRERLDEHKLAMFHGLLVRSLRKPSLSQNFLTRIGFIAVGLSPFLAEEGCAYHPTH